MLKLYLHEIDKMLWCLLICIRFAPKVVGKEQTTPTETPSLLSGTRKQLTLVNILGYLFAHLPAWFYLYTHYIICFNMY